jgi:hypothetical protein
MAVDPRVRERGHHLLLAQAQEPPGRGGGGDFDEQHVIEPDAVEGVLQCEHALDLVRDDRRVEHVADRDRRPRTVEVVGEREDRTEVVRRMAPFGGKPRVVVVEPSDQCADVERSLDRIELERRRRDARAVRNARARHDRAEQPPARLVRGRERRAAQRVGEHQPRCLARLGGKISGGRRVTREVDEQPVRLHASSRTASIARS